MATPMINSRSRFTAAEGHEHRFLLYMITYLLCAPSAFAEVVHDQGDLDAFLRKAGIDRDKAASRTREICLEFVNQIKATPTLWAFMHGTQAAMNEFLMLSTYEPPPCPNSNDAALLLTTANGIKPGVPVNPMGPR